MSKITEDTKLLLSREKEKRIKEKIKDIVSIEGRIKYELNACIKFDGSEDALNWSRALHEVLKIRILLISQPPDEYYE